MSNENAPEIKMDAKELYQEDTFTDQKVGTIRRMTPVTIDGDIDASRPVMFVGHAQMMTPAGALPLTFEIHAENLAQAIEAYGDAASQSLEETMIELQEMRRQQASQIVMPGDPASQIQMS